MRKKCVNCKESEAAFSANCLLVHHESKELYRTNAEARYDVREALCGGTRAGLCEACLEKAIKQDAEPLAAPSWELLAVFMLVGGILALIFGGPASFGMEVLVPYRWLIIGGAAVLIVLASALIIVCKRTAARSVRQTPWMLLGRRGLDSKKQPDDGQRYVPVGDGCYKDFEAFRKVNHYLLYETQEKLYKDFIENGAWKSLVDPDASEG